MVWSLWSEMQLYSTSPQFVMSFMSLAQTVQGKLHIEVLYSNSVYAIA